MTDTFEIRIDKLVYGGDGLGKLDGQAVFVPMTAPGDLVRVRTVNRRKGFLRAEVVELLEPGEGRRTPPCQHFGTCGGCQLQHLTYSAQLTAKAAAVRETLERLGHIAVPDDLSVVADPDHELGYRIRATAHIAHTRGGALFGFFAAGSNRIVDVAHCPLLVPELDEAWHRAHDAAGTLARVTTLELAAGDATVSADPPIAAVPATTLEVAMGDFVFSYPTGGFFQVNRHLLTRLVEHVVAGECGNRAVDLFAGVGLFTLPLSRCFGHVIGVESHEQSVAAARANSARNNVGNATFAVESVERWLQASGPGAGPIDLVVLDPPRAGLGVASVEAVVSLEPARVVYASCDPSTLARDVKAFVAGGYEVTSVALFDLFPQTFHIETVVRLRRSASAVGSH